MNQARALHEATQLALKGHKVLMACPCICTEPAERLIEGLARTFLLYDTPRKCTHEPIGVGWSVRLRSQGEVFFSPFCSSEDRYFDYFFPLRSPDDIRSDLKSQGLPESSPIPLEWDTIVPLVREPVLILSRYQRVQVRMRSVWDTSQ